MQNSASIAVRRLALMSRAESEDCQPASAALLHPVNPLPSITRSARLIPLPRAARCKSPPGCLLIAHEVWRLSSFSPGKFCELRDFAYGQNLYVLYAKFPPPKAKRLQLVYAPRSPQGKNDRLRFTLYSFFCFKDIAGYSVLSRK